MIYFLDTSAFVKRYMEEPGSAQVRRLLRRDVEIAAARITEAEAYAAISRAARLTAITPDERDRVFDQLSEDLGEARIVEIRRAVIKRVRELVVRRPLRGYDAVQLACALHLHAEGLAIDFWCADGSLAAAARGEGLRVTVV